MRVRFPSKSQLLQHYPHIPVKHFLPQDLEARPGLSIQFADGSQEFKDGKVQLSTACVRNLRAKQGLQRDFWVLVQCCDSEAILPYLPNGQQIIYFKAPPIQWCPFILDKG